MNKVSFMMIKLMLAEVDPFGVLGGYLDSYSSTYMFTDTIIL